MKCRREGCEKTTPTDKAEFCGVNCRVAAHRAKKKGMLIDRPAAKPKKMIVKASMYTGDGGSNSEIKTPPGVDPKSIVMVGVPAREEETVRVVQLACGCIEDEKGRIKRYTRDVCPQHRTVRAIQQAIATTEKASRIAERILKRTDHSPGCPCWTCKGVPPKKTIKKT